MKTRVRFAPSPTGLFHVGSARVALANYLFAKKTNGVFILRIEDTDKKRSKEKYEKNIIDSLSWLGVDYDEGPEKGGNFGPYRQSERAEVYEKHIKKLLDEKIAYPCFCSEDELEKVRKKQREDGEAPKYNGKCTNLSDVEIEKRIKNGEDYVIRIKVEDGNEVSFEDRIRGEVKFKTDTIGDFVVAKNKKEPLYNLACVVDDYIMEITDVIRGEDHISNTPKQIIIQELLGFNSPKYAHLPLILAPDKSKLSKRFGAVSVSEYKKEGFLPEALVNFLALLGWSPGDDREFFSLNELESEFSIERCKKGGAVFDKKKLKYINTLHIKSAEAKRLTHLCLPYLIEEDYITPIHTSEEYPPAMGAKGLKIEYETKDGRIISFDFVKEIVKEHQDRINLLSEITEVSDYFFNSIKVDFNLLKWKEMKKEEVRDFIDKAIDILSNIEDWDKELVSEKLLEEANKLDDRGRFLWPLRAALTGKKNSAGPFEVTYILGREEAIKRLEQSKKNI